MQSKSLTVTTILSTIILMVFACDKVTEPPQESVPIVTTNEVTNVTSSSATTGGDITSDGGAAVISRGVCWSTNANPTIDDNTTTDGTGIGSFTSTITGLLINTTYYVRAYATNSVGTGYGGDISFTTLSDNNQFAYLGQTPPGVTPVLFVPAGFRSNENWWWHARVDFLNDGQEMYMDIYCPAEGGIRIRYSKLENGQWTSPAPAPFASQYLDASPSFLNNGGKVFFISTRPNGVGYGYWSSVKSGGVWSSPQPVNVPVNSELSGGWEISLTNDETIYSRMEVTNGSTFEDIFVIRKINGAYSAPERLSDNINSPYHEWDVFVDPDEDYLLFCSDRLGGYGGMDIYISFKNEDGSWGAARNLGQSINSTYFDTAPSVSPDKQYLFFSSDRHGDRDPYWVSASVIESLR